MRSLSVLLVPVMVLCGKVIGQPVEGDFSERVAIQPIAGNLYRITCIGGEEFNLPPYETNLVASIGEDGVLLIDAGFGATGAELKKTLAAFAGAPVKMLINTHYHGDHTSGNQYFGDEAVIMAHRNAFSMLSGDYYHLPGSANPNRATVGIGDALLIHFNGETIRIIHVPTCHSAGDVYIYFVESKVTVIGDLLFPDEFPYIDLGNSGTVEGYRHQIKRFINDFPDDVVFYSAHGRPCNKDDLAGYYSMLTETIRLIRTAADSGQTDNDMIQNNLLAGWAGWSGSFPTTTTEAWIRTVYAEVSGQVSSRPSICRPLTKTLASGTAAEAIAQYRRLKATRADEYNFGEAELNMLGYQLMYRDRLDEAIEFFELNIEAYPEAFNVYDSYGEALLKAGDTAQSIVNYEKSLEINPENANAVEVLKKLHR